MKSIWELHAPTFIIFSVQSIWKNSFWPVVRLFYDKWAVSPTGLAALELKHKIRREIDQMKTPFSVYLDLSKAFDTLNHGMLLNKPQYYDLRDTTLNWFKN